MKKAGIIILEVSLLLTLITGFNYVTKEKIVDIGSMEIYADKNHSVVWSPLAGIAMMIAGGVVYPVGGKER